MTARLQSEADHSVLVDASEATGLADADAFLEMGEHGDGLVFREPAVEQGSTGPLTKALLASAAGQVTVLLGGAVAKSHAEIAQATLAVVGTVGILTEKFLEFVHGAVLQKKGAGNCHHT
jgi:hypothetical protein